MKGSNLPAKVRLSLRRLAAELHRRHEDAELYLFGSYARGDWLNDSDVDVIVISKAFEGQDWGDRVKQVRMLAPKEIGFEILAYTPKEFEIKSSSSIILQDASRYWIKIDQLKRSAKAAGS